MVVVSGCSFQGWNSLPLPGAVGRGHGASVYHVEVNDVGTLESNSPVMVNNVVVGSVGDMTVNGWHADVEVSVKPGVVVPANAVATVGQTSLLGSMHLSLDPPVGQQPTGRLQPGATVPLDRSSTYPSTERTLSSLSAVVNGGGLGQIGDVIHNFNAALAGHQDAIRELLGRLDRFVGMLNDQRDDIIATIRDLNRFAGTLANQRDVISTALQRIPPALDVLIREEPRLTTTLDRLRTFSDTANQLVGDTKVDLVRNLQNLGPTIRALADVGPELDTALAYALTFPYTQGLIDRAIRGDYMNLSAVIDLTIPRLKRTLFLGTRWGQEGAKLVPAPGDPWYLNYTYEPLNVGIAPAVPTPDAAPGTPAARPMVTTSEPVLPIAPPPFTQQGPPPPADSSQSIFAGPYPADAVQGGGR
ncbi:MCE family protein [Mycobacterium sp. CVI_P3]|uniref:MCE family protein n=1 Tax=Mycobacterium pinniadriaticum TaxID=2994102 RepID=A0ABT3SQ15_9MYCO|nr:MCE family protein [Mycobacterium pinniadriaticum]MCX2934552.1 MCE family protein [Mycobacterium pinniadriaticum]MCX2940975.1 MCE family protein [Mycobacterium pinniadriaticum]